jgi:RNA polymerase sigma-70 factor, ECF subfamily
VADLLDDELIQRVVRQDQQAFLLLYDRYANRVYTLALYILGDAQLAEEITQDVFLKFWNRADRFLAQRGAFAPWLLAIARNTALDRLRLEKRRPVLSTQTNPDDIWELLPQEGSSSEEARWRALYFALKALPNEQRMVIELAYYQGMSHSEIAAELEWPIGTVKTRMRLGLDALRQQWLEDEIPNSTSGSAAQDV